MTIAKRHLRAGESLDGEGGFTVYGRLAPAARSLACGALPIGLARGARLRTDVEAGAVVRRQDVTIDEESVAARLRHELEARTVGD
jgi:predicted homoserine dehydrogenase-like protein